MSSEKEQDKVLNDLNKENVDKQKHGGCLTSFLICACILIAFMLLTTGWIKANNLQIIVKSQRSEIVALKDKMYKMEAEESAYERLADDFDRAYWDGFTTGQNTLPEPEIDPAYYVRRYK